MAVLPWRTGTVIRIENHTYNTRRFWVEVSEVSSFDFIPGQFITLDLPIHEKSNKRWRSYSIASWPDGTNVFELVIVFAEGGAGSGYIFNHIKVGSTLSFRGPQGVFTLPEVLDKEIFLICTGTGIAPFRSMMYHLKSYPAVHNNIYLIFGTRKKGDILYYDEMKALASEIPGFYYITTLSREQWEGRQGYVHEIYEELCKEKQPAHFYLCGWKNMVDEAHKRILAMGYDKKSIHRELYG